MDDFQAKFDSTCACCIGPLLVVVLIVSVISFKLFIYIFNLSSTSDTKRSTILSWISGLLTVAVTLAAAGLGVLSVHDDLREQVFASMCTSMTRSSKLDPVRCNLLSNLKGNVLEFGPGPGTNFRCWSNNSDILNWVGVEPNKFFSESAVKAMKNYSISFPTSTVWLNGENVDVEAGSFDSVVVTHVLCSVADSIQVLKQVHRALKPGGTFYFMEHVAAPSRTFLSYVQIAMSPIFYIVGNGCSFKETWADISDSGIFDSYNISLKHFSADVPLPFLAPHIIGTAVKY